MKERGNNSLPRLLLYAGLSKEDYDRIQPLYLGPNWKLLNIFSLATAAGTLGFLIFSFINERLGQNTEAYLTAFLLSLAIGIVNIIGGRSSMTLLSWLCGIFIAGSYILAMIVGTFGTPGGTAVTFIVLLMAMPLIFNGRPAVQLGEMLAAALLFCLISLMIKAPEVASVDIADVSAFATASVVLKLYVARSNSSGCLARLEAEEANQALEAAARESASAVEDRSRFLFNMSHDIRTPMNAVLGFTEIGLKHTDDPERMKDCLQKIRQSGSLLLSLINNVLDVSRIESHAAQAEEKPGDVLYSFVNIEPIMQELAESKNIRLTFEFGRIADRFVYVDMDRCARIFTNIISNAVKYTNEGGNVRVRCEQIGRESAGYAFYQYTFEDNGIGMSPEFQKHMFDSFAREETASSGKVQGTGLGLAVCKTFVEFLNGSISCSSERGVGTTFTILLPFRVQEGQIYIDPETGTVVNGSAPHLKKAGISLVGRRVLLVDDNELNREMGAELLGEAGMTVETAVNGSEALDRLRDRDPLYFDFILMDVQMPVMDGLEATRIIRQRYPDDRIPIIALSANAFAEDREKSMAAGMDDHIAKPFTVEGLSATLAKIL